MTAPKERVLILCTGNSARSQMAEGLLRHVGGHRFHVESAGTRPSVVRPEAIAVMQEIGIDITAHRSKHVDEFRGLAFDYVITVCDDAREACPIFPGARRQMHWSFPDPAAVRGELERRHQAFRDVRDALRRVLSAFAEAADPSSVTFNP